MNKSFLINENPDFEIWEEYGIITIPDNQLLKTFPEAKKEIPQIIKRQKADLKKIEELENKIKEICFNKIKKLQNLEFTTDLYIAAYGKQKEKAELKRLIKLNTSLISDKPLHEFNVEKVKQIPITNYIEIGASGFARCPIHNEKTASLKYYPHNNSFYCFGCGVGGDIITFIQKRDGVSFKEAIKILTT